MKKLFLLLTALLFCMATIAQEDSNKNGGLKQKDSEIKTVFNTPHSHGAYGAFALRYMELDNKDGMSIGGRFGWIIDHSVALGLGGRYFFNEASYCELLGEDYNIGGFYGGFFIEPIIGARFPFHLAMPVFIGAGGVGYTMKFYDDWEDENLVDGDPFFILEPGMEFEINLIRLVRLSFGVYYRYTSGVNLETTADRQKLVSSNLLKGFSYGLTFKFGKF